MAKHQWEYMMFHWTQGRRKLTDIQQCNLLGEIGWEVISSYETKKHGVVEVNAFSKRRKI